MSKEEKKNEEKRIKKHIANGDIEKAIEHLSILYRHNNIVTNIKGRFKYLKQSTIKGTASEEFRALEAARISESILGLLNRDNIYVNKYYPQYKKLIFYIGLPIVLLLLLFLPKLNDRELFPNLVTGFILDANNQPVKNVELRLINSQNEDVTKGEWLTDDNGFYILESTETHIANSSFFKVFLQNCEKPYLIKIREKEINN